MSSMEPAKGPVSGEDGEKTVKGAPQDDVPSANKSAPQDAPAPKARQEDDAGAAVGVAVPVAVQSVLSVLHYPPTAAPVPPPSFGKPTPVPHSPTQSLLPAYRRGSSSEGVIGSGSGGASSVVGVSSSMSSSMPMPSMPMSMSGHRPFTALALGRSPLLLPPPSGSPSGASATSGFHGRLRVLLLQSGDHPLRHTLILDRLALHTTVGQVLELVAQELAHSPSPSPPLERGRGLDQASLNPLAPLNPPRQRARLSSIRAELRALHPYGHHTHNQTQRPSGALVLEEWVLLSSLDFKGLTEPALVLQRRVRGLLASSPAPAPSSPLSEPEGANNELGLPRPQPSKTLAHTHPHRERRLLLSGPGEEEEEEEEEVEGVVCMTCLDLLEGPVKDRGSHCGLASSGYSTHHMCFLCISRMMDTDPARFRPESSSASGGGSGGGGLSLVFQCPHPDCRQRHRLSSLHHLSPPVLHSFLQRASQCVTCGQGLEDRAQAPRCMAGHGHCDDCLHHKVRWGLEGGEQPYDGALPCECVLAEGAARCTLRIPREQYLHRLPSSLRVWVSEEMLRERAALVAGYEQDFPPSAEAVTLFLEETILNLRCPHCRKAFSDHSACPSVRCSSCRLDFCARCLRRREHCPGFDKDHGHEEWHTERRTRRLVGYLLGYDCSEELLHDIFNPAFRQLLRSIGLQPDTIVESVTLGRRSITQTLLLQHQHQHPNPSSGGANAAHHQPHHRAYSRSGSSGGGGSAQSHAHPPHSHPTPHPHPRGSAFRALAGSGGGGQEEGGHSHSHSHEEGGGSGYVSGNVNGGGGGRGPLSRENSGSGRSALLLNSITTNMTRHHHRPSQQPRSGSGDWGAEAGRRGSESLRIGEEGEGEEEGGADFAQHYSDNVSPTRHTQAHKVRGRVGGVGPFPALPSPSLPPNNTNTNNSTVLRAKEGTITGLLLPLGGVEEEEEEGGEEEGGAQRVGGQRGEEGGRGRGHSEVRQATRAMGTQERDSDADRRTRAAAGGATGARGGGSLSTKAGTARGGAEQTTTTTTSTSNGTSSRISSNSARSIPASGGERGEEEGGLEAERWGMVIKTKSPVSSVLFVLFGCANLFLVLLVVGLMLLFALAENTPAIQPKRG